MNKFNKLAITLTDNTFFSISIFFNTIYTQKKCEEEKGRITTKKSFLFIK